MVAQDIPGIWSHAPGLQDRVMPDSFTLQRFQRDEVLHSHPIPAPGYSADSGGESVEHGHVICRGVWTKGDHPDLPEFCLTARS